MISFRPQRTRRMPGTSAQSNPPAMPASAATTHITGLATCPATAAAATPAKRAPTMSWPSIPMFQTPARSEMSSPALTISKGAIRMSVSVMP